MLRYLLDTTMVLQPILKIPSIGVMRKITSMAEQCATAAPIWYDLQFSCKRMPAGKRRDVLEDYLANVVSTLEILPYDDAAALLHATERARLEQMGVEVPFADGQIAAIAQVNQLVLVTACVRDFAPFAGITVETWA